MVSERFQSATKRMKEDEPRVPTRPLGEGGETKTLPRGPQRDPEPPKIPPSVPKNTPRGPTKVASLLPVLCCSSRLNHLQFITQLCIGSSQETIKSIQELSKTNILEPPSFQASLPLSLQVPAAKGLGGMREAQTIIAKNTTLFHSFFYSDMSKIPVV